MPQSAKIGYPPSPHLLYFRRKDTHFRSSPSALPLNENRAVLPCNQIVAPILSERFYGGIREKSIEYFPKVYRVFSDRIGATLRYLPSSLRYLRTNAPSPPIPHSVSFVQTIRNLPSSVLSPCNTRFVTTHSLLQLLRTSGWSAQSLFPTYSVLLVFYWESIRICPALRSVCSRVSFPNVCFILHFVSCGNSVHREKEGKLHGRTELGKGRHFRLGREISSGEWGMAKKKDNQTSRLIHSNY